MPRLNLPEDPIERAARLTRELAPLLQAIAINQDGFDNRKRFRELAGNDYVFVAQLNLVWLSSERAYSNHKAEAQRQHRLQ